ncbi:MAG: D-alanyl-D-alanine carboxypeptidase [Sneathiella sp.]|nr:MAG: D-alanyl-D-alanine carboxypeptidase [Sneathiella sp.]
MDMIRRIFYTPPQSRNSVRNRIRILNLTGLSLNKNQEYGPGISRQKAYHRMPNFLGISWRVLSVFLVVSMMTAVFFPTSSHARYAAVVMDSRTGEILYSRNADKKLYPASLTKIMTLYMTFDALTRGKLRLDQKLSVSARAAGQAPTKLGLKRGGTITVRDAMFGLITKSANDAATVLAESMAKSEVDFALDMTATAKRLGMRRTSFRNASGLPNRRQKSTARDMAILGSALIHEFPQYYHFMSLEKFKYKGRSYKNHNNLLKKYKGADGIKTGYIRASGFNLVASAKRGSNRLVGVVFGGKSAKSRDIHMAALLDKGFAMIEASNPSIIPFPAEKPLRIALHQPHSKTARVQIARTAPVAVKAAPSVNHIRIVKAEALPRLAPLPVNIAANVDGIWAIQIGAFSRVTTARDQVYKAAAQSNGMLEGRRVNIEKAISNGKPFYRAQVIGFNELEARKTCTNLSERRFSCFVVSPKLKLPVYIADKSSS